MIKLQKSVLLNRLDVIAAFTPIIMQPVVFVQHRKRDSYEGDKLRCWLSACPGATEAAAMVSIVDAPFGGTASICFKEFGRHC